MKIKREPLEEVYYALKKNVKAPTFFKDFGENFKAELTPYPDEAWTMRNKERLLMFVDEYSKYLKEFEIVKISERVLTEYNVESVFLF